jgi:hypothetical protein
MGSAFAVDVEEGDFRPDAATQQKLPDGRNVNYTVFPDNRGVLYVTGAGTAGDLRPASTLH